jgi:hypothetical protein
MIRAGVDEKNVKILESYADDWWDPDGKLT